MAKSFNQSRSPIKDVKEFEEEVIKIDRVTRVVKGGRRMRFRATVVIGDKRGKVGIGIGKSNEVAGAIKKAVNKAKKNMIIVPIINESIPHDIKVKFKSAKVLLIPAAPGTGIIAGGPVRKVVELAGIKNILSKALGSPSRINNTKATFMALKGLRSIQPKKVPVTLAKPIAPVSKSIVNQNNIKKPIFSDIKNKSKINSDLKPHEAK